MTDKTREAEKGCPPPMVDKVKSRIAVHRREVQRISLPKEGN